MLLPPTCGFASQVKILFFFFCEEKIIASVLLAPSLADVSEALPVPASTEFDPFYSESMLHTSVQMMKQWLNTSSDS